VPVNVRADDCPEHIGLAAVNDAVGVVRIVKTTLPEAITIHGFAPPLETLTSAYVVAAVNAAVVKLAVPEAERVMVCATPPLMLYETIAPGVPVKLTVPEEPEQIEDTSVVIVADSVGPAKTANATLLVQPVASVTRSM